MKKTIMILMVATIFMHGWASANEPGIKQLSPEELRLMAQGAVNKYGDERFERYFLSDMTMGSLVGAPLAVYYLLQHRIGGGWKTLAEASLLSMVAKIGSMMGTRTMMELMDLRQNWKINNALEARTKDHLEYLSSAQKLLFIAAYRRDLPLMKLLVAYQPAFLEKAGVWEALAELFFNQKPTAENVQQLKEMIAKANYPKI